MQLHLLGNGQILLVKYVLPAMLDFLIAEYQTKYADADVFHNRHVCCKGRV